MSAADSATHFTTAESADDPASIAYRGLVKMHAQYLVSSAHFQRSGRLTPNNVHAIARALDKLDRKHPLDATIELVLAEADARDLQRAADAESREPSAPGRAAMRRATLSSARVGASVADEKLWKPPGRAPE